MSSTLVINNSALDELCKKAKKGLRADFAKGAVEYVDAAYQNRKLMRSWCVIGWFIKSKTKKQVREQLDIAVHTGPNHYHYWNMTRPTKHQDYKQIEKIQRACFWAGEITISLDDLVLLEKWAVNSTQKAKTVKEEEEKNNV